MDEGRGGTTRGGAGRRGTTNAFGTFGGRDGAIGGAGILGGSIFSGAGGTGILPVGGKSPSAFANAPADASVPL